MKKVLAATLLVPFLGSVIIEQPAHANWFKKNLPKIDVTNRNSDINKFGRKADPTNPNSNGGRFVRKTVPVACGTVGAIVSAAGVATSAAGAAVGYQGCYRVVNDIQK